MNLIIAIMILILESFFGTNFNPICNQIAKSTELFATFNLNQLFWETNKLEVKKEVLKNSN